MRIGFETIMSTLIAGTMSNEKRKVFNILALHGKGGSGVEFQRKLARLIEKTNDIAPSDVNVKWTFLDAPFEGGQWWLLPPNTRSFEANEYMGFRQSKDIVMDEIKDNDVDLVVGHSQGAILISALLASNSDGTFPRCVLNGAAWPNPFTSDLYEAQRLKVWENRSRALFVIGKNDKINPPSSARKVFDCFREGGMKVEIQEHDGGHSIPTHNDESLVNIASWIMASMM